eukprot:5728337-Pleurochrysis_carterae.AAC.2
MLEDLAARADQEWLRWRQISFWFYWHADVADGMVGMLVLRLGTLRAVVAVRTRGYRQELRSKMRFSSEGPAGGITLVLCLLCSAAHRMTAFINTFGRIARERRRLPQRIWFASELDSDKQKKKPHVIHEETESLIEDRWGGEELNRDDRRYRAQRRSESKYPNWAYTSEEGTGSIPDSSWSVARVLLNSLALKQQKSETRLVSLALQHCTSAMGGVQGRLEDK